jgi:hypothetical protein
MSLKRPTDLSISTTSSIPRMRLSLVLTLFFGLATAASAQQPGRIPNPVLDDVADSGVLKYNGGYYLMGVGTDGDMYASPNTPCRFGGDLREKAIGRRL